MYWRIGKLIGERSEWGNRFIDSLSGDIRLAYPGIRGFSVRSLKYMLRLAREYDLKFVQQVVAQIRRAPAAQHVGSHWLERVQNRGRASRGDARNPFDAEGHRKPRLRRRRLALF